MNDDSKAPAAQDDSTEEDPGAETRAWRVQEPSHGLRLDKELVLKAPEFSRNHLQSLISAGLVRIDGQVATTVSRKLKLGQAIELVLQPTASSGAFTAEDMALDIVHEDAHLIVINKPTGLVVHPAAGHWSGTLLNGLLAHHPGALDLPRAGIVHRLDKDTSGLMVVAKTLPAMTELVRAIAAREVHREYRALCWGRVAAGPLQIEEPIGRDPVVRTRMAVIRSGKPARTDVQHLASMPVAQGQISAVACRLHTGRTHQIRVHLSHRGHPLVADALYGGQPALELQRQALHAQHLGFVHPVLNTPAAFVAPMPPDLQRAWQAVAASS